MTSSNSTHVPANNSILFSFMSEQSFIVCICHISVTHSTADEHTGTTPDCRENAALDSARIHSRAVYVTGPCGSSTFVMFIVIHVCVFTLTCVHAAMHMWGSEDNSLLPLGMNSDVRPAVSGSTHLQLLGKSSSTSNFSEQPPD